MLLTLVLVAGTAADASAKSCGHMKVRDRKNDVTWKATVEVHRGRVTCLRARRLARTLLSGRARWVDNGYSYQSYFVVPGGWRGTIHTGSWLLQNAKRGAEVGGDAIPV